MLKPTRYIQGMMGLGDTIYLRPFIKHLATKHNLYYKTAWPQLAADLDVKCVSPGDIPLRTQAKNIKQRQEYVNPPVGKPEHVHYGPNLQTSNIMDILNSFLKIPTGMIKMDLDCIPRAEHEFSKPLAIIRPITSRKEWHNSARNPLPEYVEQISKRLMDTHHVVSIADLETGEEWLEQKVTYGHQRFHKGELDVVTMLSWMKAADIVVGGVGFIVPACQALGVNAFIVGGGQGAYNHPNKVLNPYQITSNIGWALPDTMHMCTNMRCQSCDKIISNLEGKFDTFMEFAHA